MQDIAYTFPPKEWREPRKLYEQWERKGVRPEVSTRRQPMHRKSYHYAAHVQKIFRSGNHTKSQPKTKKTREAQRIP